MSVIDKKNQPLGKLMWQLVLQNWWKTWLQEVPFLWNNAIEQAINLHLLKFQNNIYIHQKIVHHKWDITRNKQIAMVYGMILHMILHDMILHDMILHDMIWYGMIWYMIWYDTMWSDVIYAMIYGIWHMIWYEIWYDIICYDMIYAMLCYAMLWFDRIYAKIWYDVMWCGVVWYDMIWYGMIWYDMIYDMHDMTWHDII